MSTTIVDLFKGQTKTKQDFRADWKEDTKKDFRIDFPLIDWTAITDPAFTGGTPTFQTFSLGAGAGGTVFPIYVTAHDVNAPPMIPLAYLWEIETGDSAELRIVDATLASTALIVPSVVGNWTLKVTVTNSRHQSQTVTGALDITVTA